MARAATPTPDTVADDAIDQVMTRDNEKVASDLEAELDTLSTLDQGTIKGILYCIPRDNAAFEWIREIYPPFDLSDIMDSLKTDFGGGKFCLRIMVNKKIRKNLLFTVRRDPLWKPPKAEAENGLGGGSDIIQLLMAQANASKTDMMTFMQMNMQQQAAQQAAQAAAAQQSQQLMMGMITAILPVIAGGREKTSEMMQAFAALQPKAPEGGGMKDTLEMLTVAKGLFGGAAEPTGLADGIVENAIKFGGPLLGSIGEAIANRRQNAPPVQQVYALPEQNMPQASHVPLPPPTEGPAAAPGRFPALDAIREDVLFLFGRKKSPELAADVVLETLEAANITEEQLQDVIAAFTISPNWIDDLAAEGIDLRSDPVWANQFLSTLIQLYTDPGDGDDDSAGGEGRVSDSGHHGPSGAPGVDVHADPQRSGEAD